MKWSDYKKLLGDKVVQVSNPNTPNETLSLWNGSIVCKYDEEKHKQFVLDKSDTGAEVVDFTTQKVLYRETFERYLKEKQPKNDK